LGGGFGVADAYDAVRKRFAGLLARGNGGLKVRQHRRAQRLAQPLDVVLQRHPRGPRRIALPHCVGQLGR